ncbi:polysaccharide pyruvyl transferase family protein [Roseibium sp.]|uniref:polysaccharide pyruvyl transferase family protein n=1 Tax=Roseibium sp. TaxID=1936156 RepID=UPI003BAB7ED7
MTDNSVLTIGLLWHSTNSDNLGIGALTASQIVILEEVAAELNLKLTFKILGWRDPEPSYINGPNIQVVPMRARDLLSPSGLWSSARSCDLILDISAGDSFADIYGRQRFLYNIISKTNVIASRRPLILSPQTIGPFQRWWTRLLATVAMRGARKVLTRDRLSSDYLSELGLADRLIESTDVAMRLPYETPAPREDGNVRVGLNVSGLLFNGGYSQDNMFALSADYAAVIHALCEYFTKQPGVELHLLGHVNSRNHEVEDDYRVAERLAEKYPSAVLAPRFENPSAAKTYIATMDFFAGARMHACIAAFSSGVPVLSMAYSRKFAGLFGTLGYDHLADCKTQSTEEIIEVVTDAFARRQELKADVDNAFQEAERKLLHYKDYLREVMKNAKLGS